MAEYSLLRILAYASQEKAKETAAERKASEGAFDIGLTIHPDKKAETLALHVETDVTTTYPLFFVSCRQLQILKDRIYANSKTIQNLEKRSPPAVLPALFKKLLINEVQASNEMEGIQSSRREIESAMAEAEGSIKRRKKQKFVSYVKEYLNFQDNQYSSIKCAADFRHIYDAILTPEEVSEWLEEGYLFRSGSTSVKDRGTPIHRGIASNQINQKMQELAEFMNRDDIPALEKAAVSHYYFEYIHPFYDGNGRAGRYIFAAYLARKLDRLSAVCLSYSAKKNQKLYADAFFETTHKNNFGDATFFIMAMLEIIAQGQKEIIAFMQNKLDIYEKADEKLRELGNTEIEKNILNMYAQSWVFFEKAIHQDKMIAKAAHEAERISRRSIDKALQSLREKGVLEQTQKKPSEHRLEETYLHLLS